MISGGTVNPEFGEGFGLLPKVIIDQHFSQKKREERLAKGVAMYPDLLGLGIDESTGIEWNAKQAKVLGLGQVHHYAIESTNNKPHWEQVQRESFPEGTLFQPNKYPRLFEQ